MQFKKLKYQTRAVEDMINFYKAWDNKKSKPGLAVLPTGSGKSVIQAMVVNKLGINVLVIQPSVELLIQNYEKYVATGNQACLFSASANSKEVGQVTYATPLSLKGHSAKFKHVDLIIIDECHLGTTPERVGRTNKDKEVVKFIKDIEVLKKGSVCVMGLTATAMVLKQYGGALPNAVNYSKLMVLTRVKPKFFNSIFHITQIEEVLAEKMLCPIRYTVFGFDKSNIKIVGNDYEEESMAQEMFRQGIVDKIIALTHKSIARGKKRILIFAPTLQTAEYIKSKIEGSQIVTGKTKKSRRFGIIEDFKTVDNKAKVLINWGTLTTGFDAKHIDLLICGRSTMSYGLWYQIIGRGARVAEGKELCDVLDLSGNYELFGDPMKSVYVDHGVLGLTLLSDDYIITGIPVGMKIHIDDHEVLEDYVDYGMFKGSGVKVKEVSFKYFTYINEKTNVTSPGSAKTILPILKKLNLR